MDAAARPGTAGESMTERSLDPDVVRGKLDAIERACATLRSVGRVDAEKLQQDPVLAAAVERLLCRLVDLAVDTNAHISAAMLRRMPGEYRESFDLARDAGALTTDLVDKIKPSVGMRNAIVHEYLTVDYGIVAAAMPMALEMYGEFTRQIAAFATAGAD